MTQLSTSHCSRCGGDLPRQLGNWLLAGEVVCHQCAHGCGGQAESTILSLGEAAGCPNAGLDDQLMRRVRLTSGSDTLPEIPPELAARNGISPRST